MRIKAYFIMILILLTALYGAAQEVIVVFEGARSSHYVQSHSGSSYTWNVLTDFSPDVEANPNDYTFTSTNGSDQIQVEWNKVGWFYLNVTETGISGCTNRKVLPVNVISNNRSIAFNVITSSECYNSTGNTFELSLQIHDDGGVSLAADEYPVTADFTVNGIANTQLIYFDQQSLNIDDAWLINDPDQELQIEVQLNSVKDINGIAIPLVAGSESHVRTIHHTPQLQFITVTNILNQGETSTYQAGFLRQGSENAVYHWMVDPPGGTSSDLGSFDSETARVLWDGNSGVYKLKVWATDMNGCVADTIETNVEVLEPQNPFGNNFALTDTVIGSCDPYLIDDVVGETNYTYLWEPADYLSDPTLANPVFTPGESTTYVLTVTNQEGKIARDTVNILVANIMADAGADVLINNENTIVLDGSTSTGESLNYVWTTANGKIDEGSSTAYPVISQPGTYYLEVIDAFGCIATDSVKVSLFTNAPIARNDYDTTAYQTAVNIDVLLNDSDVDGDLDQASLTITHNPSNGVVYINYFDNTITYTPDQNFVGTDAFEYQICDLSQQCDNATVYVLVTPLNFLIPQAFTPNGDNINDFFQILGIENYPNNTLKVINRWGKKVFEANAYGIATNPKFWDGRSNVGSNNGVLPTGTYFYVLELGNGEKPIAGSVYIDR